MAAYRRFDLDKRITFQKNLSDGLSFAKISDELGMSASSVGREVKQYRTLVNTYGVGHTNRCIHRRDCSISGICPGQSGICRDKKCNHCRKQNCNQACSSYGEEVCRKLDSPPYVCNQCIKKKYCPLKKYMYYADQADKKAREIRKESRSGLTLTEDEVKEIDTLLSDRLKMGQSVHHIFVDEPDVFTISEKQAYNLINQGLISARPIDLPRAVRMKPRSKKAQIVKVDKKCRIGRTYEDYLKFMEEHPDFSVLQGDSVEGKKGGKCILTLTWANWDFQIAFLRDHNNSASVTSIVNHLYESLGAELFQKVMPAVWLLDNGSEFSNPSEIEKFGVYVFYCDPGAPYQKPNCENTHSVFRRIIPKGHSFNDLDQDFFDLAFSHTNSLRRKKLNDHTPYEMFSFAYGDDIAEKCFRIHQIQGKDVILDPSLVRIYRDSRRKEGIE